ncbi:MAG: hypothetical protein ACI9V1_003570, partial [Spirosomataceae bacterium]
ERVTLTYHEKFFKFPWNGETKNFIIDVAFLPKPEQPVYQAVPPPPPPAVVDSVTNTTNATIQPEAI